MHPMTVTVPIGCWLGATVLDVVGGEAGRPLARRLTALGLAAAVPAAASGTADWADTQGAERRVGVVHAVANIAASAAFGGSWLARRARRHALGRVLSGMGLVTVGAAGYLGGHLAYVRGVGVNTTAFQSGPDDWTPLADLRDLPVDEPVSIRSGGIGLVAVRRSERDDAVAVLEDRCSHRGGPLGEGWIDGDCVVCPWHGSSFELGSGRVRQGPASVAQPAYDTRVVDGRLEVRRTEHGALRRNPVGARA
ncbi:MAG: Rieske (2Fe-2S) protein [Ilumatobacteraceae bacterium]|nr:Rieske (2Fe-2S) protein [Ilumatobacteraceae bacterium]